MMSISITGSRYFDSRDSSQQKRFFIGELRGLYFDGVGVLHHGDAIGADSFSHQIAVSLGMNIVIHPPVNSRYRAFCNNGSVTILPTKPYLERNLDLIKATEILLVLPTQNQEIQRSGTWHTVRVARRNNRSVVIFFPDGRIARENR